jgi:hypothetical protein
MKQFKTLMIAVFGILLMLSMQAAAYADTITIGSSTSGSLTFTSNGNGTVSVSSTTLSDGAFFTSGPLGTYSFGPMTFTAGPMSSEKYPAGTNSDTFMFTDGTDILDGTITWAFIQDNTPNPKFFGTLDVTTIAGSTTFLSTFGGTGSMDPVDLTTTTISSGTLDALVSSAAGTTATVGISSGEVASGTPEPSSILLFGVGIALIALCAPPRRRFSAEA